MVRPPVRGVYHRGGFSNQVPSMRGVRSRAGTIVFLQIVPGIPLVLPQHSAAQKSLCRQGGNGGMPFISPHAFANKFLEFFDHFFGPHIIGRDMDGVNGWFQPAKFARAVAMVAFVLPP